MKESGKVLRRAGAFTAFYRTSVSRVFQVFADEISKVIYSGGASLTRQILTRYTS
ncbi:MAG TPA: hypothetical protein VGB68_05060 [Pyrinomonadaceae bacterium]